MMKLLILFSGEPACDFAHDRAKQLMPGNRTTEGGLSRRLTIGSMAAARRGYKNPERTGGRLLDLTEG
jgi:hypothetical protein